MQARKKTREEIIEEIDRKRWAAARNLGNGEGIPEEWTLCDMGPENAYLELNSKSLRKIDEDDIKGFWKETCTLITPENLEHIFKNTEAYNDLLMGGTMLLYARTEKYFLQFVGPKLRTISKTLREMLEKECSTKKGRPKYDATKEIGAGYESLDSVCSALEKDFLKITETIDGYYKTCLQNELKKLLGNKEETPLKPGQVETTLSPNDSAADVEQNEIRNLIKNKVYPSLTQRQKQVYNKTMEGKKQKQIADELEISVRTVKREKAEIINKIKKDLKITE
jgi:DNA-binding CsgD family transcriptional regulator